MSSTEPNILIAGPGALGTLYAARLGRRWQGVYLLDHRPERAAQLQEQGLHVTGASLLDWTPPPGRVRAALGRAGPGGGRWPVMDAVLFFVKAPAFAAAWKTVRSVTDARTALVVFPETVDPASALKGAGRQVVLALTEDRARVESSGRVVHEALGETFLDAGAPLAKGLLPFFSAAQVRVSLDKKVADKRWLTLLAQVCVDVPGALIDGPQSRVVEPPLAPLAGKLLAECAAVSAALKRPVTAALLRARRDALVLKAPGAKSPMGRDLLWGRATERAFLVDALLAAARKKKISTPVLSAMDLLLRRLERETPAP